MALATRSVGVVTDGLASGRHGADPIGLLPGPALPDIVPRQVFAAALGSRAMRFVLGNAGALRTSLATATVRTDDNADLAVRGDVARMTYGVSGAGIKVGILSDSFDLLHGYAADVASGDLPAGVAVLEEGQAGGHDEGRAMADLVHRIAPGAQILFHTATASETDFAAGIQALAAAGCKVIVDDVAYLDEPFYQDGGAVQSAVEQAVARGVNYFTAASNEGQQFFESGFTTMRVALPSLPGRWSVANFGTPGLPVPYINLNVPLNGLCAIDLQWDQPFASIGGGPGSSNSLAMALYASDGRLVGTAGSLGVHRDPTQLLQFVNHTGGSSFRLVILANGFAPPPDLFKFILYGNGTIIDSRAGHGSGTVTGHELVAGANTVGAMAWSATPRFGGSGQIESFSSVGSGLLTYDAHGNRLATPQDAHKVTFVAPDGDLTSVFAPFYGTSAAAPNAAAVAALMLQANPYLAPAQVSGILSASAVFALGAAGGTGAGLIQADHAVALALAAQGHQG